MERKQASHAERMGKHEAKKETHSALLEMSGAVHGTADDSRLNFNFSWETR
jgi:hypothetical protein